MKSQTLLLLFIACGLFACASNDAPPGTSAPVPGAQAASQSSRAPSAPPVVQAKPFKEAVAAAATALLASLPADVSARSVVIDPLLDGVTAEQNRATQGMEQLVQQHLLDHDKRFAVVPLSVNALQKKPLLLIGTFTGLNTEGQASGERVTYRICLALADTASGKVIAKGTARATSEGVDLTPLAYFRDAPVWSIDKVTDGYIRSCQGAKVGDDMDSFYRARLIAGASVNHAVVAYNEGRYQRALDFYSVAMRAGAGDELRIMNGVYLANWKLKRSQAAKLVVKRIVSFGIERKRMAIKFLFEPGSINFWKDRDFLATYPIWMTELASQTTAAKICMSVLGHSSRGNPDNGNTPLSQERAQFVRHLLIQNNPALEARIKAVGRGAQDNLIGNGHNDESDVLDRRVVFEVTDCARGLQSEPTEALGHDSSSAPDSCYESFIRGIETDKDGGVTYAHGTGDIRMTRARLFVGTLALLAGLSGTVEAQVPCTPRLLGFGDGGASWEARPLSKMKKDSHYSLVKEGSDIELHADADGSASFDATVFKPAIPVAPLLSWRWRTSGPIPGADNRDKSKEDSPLRVIVAFDGDISTLPDSEKRRFRRAKTFLGKDLPYALLMYTWTDKLATGSVIPSAHSSQVKMIAIAPDAAGAWQSVSRNLAEDYKRAWGTEAGKVLGIAVMTDTDNTGAKASGDYADLRFACAP